MSDVLRFPKANPLRFAILQWKNRLADDIDYNLWHKKSMPDTAYGYCQPWIKSKNLPFQYHSSFDNNFVELVRAADNVVIASDEEELGMLYEDGEEMLFEDSEEMLFEGTDEALSDGIYNAGTYVTREAEIDFETLDVTPGKYYIQVRGTHNDGETFYARSELFDVQVTQKNVCIFEYSNNEPNFDLEYRSSTFNPLFIVRADFIKDWEDNSSENFVSADTAITKVTDVTVEGENP